MIAVIFELRATSDRKDHYLKLAAELLARLEEVEGFISIERYQSLSAPEKLLSLSFWRDEAALSQWRNLPAHRHAQVEGRAGIFDDYRLRVAQVMRDYGLHDRALAPRDSREVHSPGR